MYKVYMWHWNNLFADKFAIDSERGIIYVNADLNTEGGDVSFTLTVSAENDEATGANPDTVSGPHVTRPLPDHMLPDPYLTSDIFYLHSHINNTASR